MAASVADRLARLEEQMRSLRDDIAEIGRAIHGPNGSIRNRIHTLENDAHAARAAAQALAEIRKQQGEGFTKRQQIAVLIFGLIASLGTIVSTVVAIAMLSGGGS